MPLVRIELRRGKPPEYRRTLAEQVYEAMRDAIKIPENDKFVVVSEHDPDNLVFDRTIAGAGHNDIYDRPEFRQAMREAITPLAR